MNKGRNLDKKFNFHSCAGNKILVGIQTISIAEKLFIFGKPKIFSFN